jgi:hypothetical protein
MEGGCEIAKEAYDFEGDCAAGASLYGLVNLCEGPFVEGFHNVEVVDRRQEPLLRVRRVRMHFLVKLRRRHQLVLILGRRQLYTG